MSLWDVFGEGEEEDLEAAVASKDYPVLADILVERPPLPHAYPVTASRRVEDDEIEESITPVEILRRQAVERDISAEAGLFTDILDALISPPPTDGRAPSFDWCFAGETEFLTYDGMRAFKDVAGTTQHVLDGRGIWVEAEIRSFGMADLRKVTLKKGRGTKVIYATGNHRWVVDGAADKVVTDDLQSGMALASRLPRSYLHHWKPSPFGVAHGIVYGDGTLVSETVRGTFRPGPARVDLWGDKDAQLLCYFEGHRMVEARGGANQEARGVRVTGLPRHFKQRPSLESDPAYLYGWLAGYFAADGRIAANGSNIEISSANRSDLEFVQAVCARLTIATHDIRVVNRTGCSGRGQIHDYRMDTKGECSLCTTERQLFSIALVPETLTEDLFLIAEHRERYLARKPVVKVGKLGSWCVASIEETDRHEEVFCAVVPTTESFVLQDNILTGNCRFRRDQVCYFPTHLNQEATRVAGYEVWVVKERGICPRYKWKDQEACPISEPGPNSNHPRALIECTRNWEEGGQRDGVPGPFRGPQGKWPESNHLGSTEAARVELIVRYPDVEGPQVVGSGKGTALVIFQRMLRVAQEDGATDPRIRFVGSGTEYAWDDWVRHIETGESITPLDSRSAALTWTACPTCGGLGEVTVKNWLAGPSQVTCGTCQGRGLLRNYYTDPVVFDATTVEVAAALRTAAWSDVRAKAAAIRREGGVKVIAVTDQTITAEVKGHSAVYQTTLHREPGTRRVSLWECSCPWAAYSWDRSGRWKRFEGRMCAHALALTYEAQSQEFGGGTLAEDPDSWSAQGEKPTFYEAPPKPENWQVAAARNSKFPFEIDPETGLAYLDGQVVTTYPSYHPTLGLTASVLHTAEIDPADPEAGMREVEEVCAKGDHTHSGLVIKAVDSGRLLLTQRTPYSEDPEGVYGRWEFPGGSIGEDEAPFESAMREFTEETGLELPEGWRVTGCYESGPYIAVIVLVPNEGWTTNAELLDFETMGIGWFHPDQIEGTDLVREEMEDADWEMIREAAKTAAHGIVLEQSPLDYHGVRPKRLAIRVPGEWDPKMPRGDEASASYFTPPHSATPEGDDTVAFLDFSEQGDSILIHFMAVRPDFEGKGLARLLVEHLYAMTDKDIDWGRIMSDRAEALWRSIRDAHPDRWNRARLSSVHEVYDDEDPGFQVARVLPDSPAWGAMGLPEDGTEAAEDLASQAILHDEPEPALPTAEGAEEDDEVEQRRRMLEGSSGITDADIAKAARQHLAAAVFSPKEQLELIEEGDGEVEAANLDRLQIEGTHYEALDARLQSADDLFW